jgi:hypothetical protein
LATAEFSGSFNASCLFSFDISFRLDRDPREREAE